MKDLVSKYFLLVFLLTMGVESSYSQIFTITGRVFDKQSAEPLVAANIRVDGTSRGTITNQDGMYKLTLEKGESRIIFTFIGYKSDTLELNLMENLRHDIALQQIPIQLAEVVVTDEDPTYAIMRRVIQEKKQWAEQLRSYSFEAYTRQVMRRDTAIASITESYTTGYWMRGDTLREIVRQKRQTENIAMSQNFAAVGGIMNLYDDDIRFSGYNFVGPTSENAFTYYSFRLLDLFLRYIISIRLLSVNTIINQGTVCRYQMSRIPMRLETKPGIAPLWYKL